MDRRNAVAAAALALIAMPVVACGSGSASSSSPPQACQPLRVPVTHHQLSPSTSPTTGFNLTLGSQPVGVILDRDGTSVWVLRTGTNVVSHVLADGTSTDDALPASVLGIEPAQAADGTVWVPEQYRGAVAALAPDGTARECKLAGKDPEPLGIAVGQDGSVWVAESKGKAIARLEQGRFTEYPTGVEGAELIPASDGGVWFTVNGAPILGHMSATGQVRRVPIGGSGTTLGLLQTADGAVWVADFGGDRIVRVAPDESLTEWNTAAGAKPQSLAVGQGGTMWFTESGADELARIRGRSVEEVIHTGGWPDHMVIGSDGWAWFTEYNQDRLGRVRLPAG